MIDLYPPCKQERLERKQSERSAGWGSLIGGARGETGGAILVTRFPIGDFGYYIVNSVALFRIGNWPIKRHLRTIRPLSRIKTLRLNGFRA
jgi:hypothetical protein